jgi:lactate dehydrogenase-like 2-hydroxyacid dehydrogenase
MITPSATQPTRIGILGAGKVGTVLARLAAAATASEGLSAWSEQ